MRRYRSRFAVFLDAAAALARTFAVRQERQDCRRPEVLLSIRFMGKPAQSCCFMSSKSDFSVLESRQRPENSKAATRVASTGFVFFVFLEDAPGTWLKWLVAFTAWQCGARPGRPRVVTSRTAKVSQCSIPGVREGGVGCI